MDQIGEKVVRGFRWLAIGRFAGQLVTWAVTIFIIRILSPEDYGLMAMATIVIGFLALFDELGMGAALIQQEKIDARLVSQVFGLVIVINVGAFLLLLASAPLVARFFDEPRLIEITWVLSLQFPLMALQVIPDAMIRRRMVFRQKSFVNFLGMVFGSFFSLGLAIAGFGVWALVLGSVLTVIVRTIGYNVIARYFCWPSFDFAGLRRILTFGTQVTAERLLWFVYSQADIFLVGRVLGKELLGYYSVAVHLASLPMTKLGAIVHEVSFAGFSRIQSQSEEVGRQLKKATMLISFFAFPVFFGISATAPEIVAVILGSKWSLSTAPLQIISLVIPVRMLAMVMPTALMGTGQADVSVKNAATAAAILPASFAIGLNWGLVGVCYAWLIGFTIYYNIMLLRSLPKLGVRHSEYFSQIWGVALSATVMLLTVHACRRLLPPEMQGTLLSLVVLVFVGAATFTALAVVCHRESLKLFLSIIKR